MEKDAASKIIEDTNSCIAILNSLLVDLKSSLADEEYLKFKRSVAKVIDTIDNQITSGIISMYPDLSPYK